MLVSRRHWALVLLWILSLVALSPYAQTAVLSQLILWPIHPELGRGSGLLSAYLTIGWLTPRC